MGLALGCGDIAPFLGRWSRSVPDSCPRKLSVSFHDSEMKLSEGKAESEEARSTLGQPGVLDPRLGY